MAFCHLVCRGGELKSSIISARSRSCAVRPSPVYVGSTVSCTFVCWQRHAYYPVVDLGGEWVHIVSSRGRRNERKTGPALSMGKGRLC